MKEPKDKEKKETTPKGKVVLMKEDSAKTLKKMVDQIIKDVSQAYHKAH